MLSRHWRLWLSFPLPRAPSRRAAGNRLGPFSDLRPMRGRGRVCFLGLRSRRLTEPPRPSSALGGRNPPPGCGAPPFQGGFAGVPKGSLCEGEKSAPHPSPIHRSQEKPMAHAIGFFLAYPNTPTPHVRGGSVSRRGLNQAIGTAPTLRRNQAKKRPPKRQPLFGRGGLGRGASLREAASPPPLGGGGFFFFCFGVGGGWGCGVGVFVGGGCWGPPAPPPRVS